MLKRICLALLAVCLLASPALAEGGFFKEAGVSAFYHTDMDIDHDDLNAVGIIGHLAAPFYKSGMTRVDFRLELWLGQFFGYESGTEVALVPALRVNFLAGSIWPYVEAGIGPSYNTLDIRELGMGFNFLSFGGLGIRFPMGGKTAIELGYRIRHISNAGMDEHNHGVTSHTALLGLTWAF